MGLLLKVFKVETQHGWVNGDHQGPESVTARRGSTASHCWWGHWDPEWSRDLSQRHIASWGQGQDLNRDVPGSFCSQEGSVGQGRAYGQPTPSGHTLSNSPHHPVICCLPRMRPWNTEPSSVRGPGMMHFCSFICHFLHAHSVPGTGIDDGGLVDAWKL